MIAKNHVLILTKTLALAACSKMPHQSDKITGGKNPDHEKQSEDSGENPRTLSGRWEAKCYFDKDPDIEAGDRYRISNVEFKNGQFKLVSTEFSRTDPTCSNRRGVVEVRGTYVQGEKTALNDDNHDKYELDLIRDYVTITIHDQDTLEAMNGALKEYPPPPECDVGPFVLGEPKDYSPRGCEVTGRLFTTYQILPDGSLGMGGDQEATEDRDGSTAAQRIQILGSARYKRVSK
ncbi:MAG: hypothetical protein RIQ81_663 [Pseudomonadota bacterium]|jgi:hypothetical protein